MPPRFAIVNGIAGTGVRQALNRYADWCSRNGFDCPLLLSLEEDYLLPLARDITSTLHSWYQPADVTIMEVLLLPQSHLNKLWSDAFNEAMEDVRKARQAGRPVILTFHAVWFHLANREYVSGIDFVSLARLDERPDIVLTLVDDIYDVKARLSRPNGIFSYPVSSPDDYLPSILQLLQILDWRNAENVLSSKVAEVSNGIKHFVLAVKHPISVFHDLFTGSEKKLVYIAHPISEVRRLWRGAGDQRQLAEEIVERVRDLSRRLREHFVVFEPTAIDELRFDVNFEIERQSFDLPILGWRWPLPSSESSDLLFEGLNEVDDAFGPGWTSLASRIADTPTESLEEEQVGLIRRAWPLLSALQQKILDQITARDYSLVTQVDGLAVYRPAFRGHESGGVRKEITHHQNLRLVGLPRATAVILHPEEDERDTILQNFKRHLKHWWEEKLLRGTQERFDALIYSLTVDHINPIQDADTDAGKGRAISELLRQWSIEFVTSPAGAMSAAPAAIARVQESERGEQFRGMRSYLAELLDGEDVEVIRINLSIQDFVQKVVNRSENRV